MNKEGSASCNAMLSTDPLPSYKVPGNSPQTEGQPQVSARNACPHTLLDSLPSHFPFLPRHPTLPQGQQNQMRMHTDGGSYNSWSLTQNDEQNGWPPSSTRATMTKQPRSARSLVVLTPSSSFASSLSLTSTRSQKLLSPRSVSFKRSTATHRRCSSHAMDSELCDIEDSFEQSNDGFYLSKDIPNKILKPWSTPMPKSIESVDTTLAFFHRQEQISLSKLSISIRTELTYREEILQRQKSTDVADKRNQIKRLAACAMAYQYAHEHEPDHQELHDLSREIIAYAHAQGYVHGDELHTWDASHEHMYDVCCKRDKLDINRDGGLQNAENSASGGSQLYPPCQHKQYDTGQKPDVDNHILDGARIGNLNGKNCLEFTGSSACRLYQPSEHNLCYKDRKCSVEDATQEASGEGVGHVKVTNSTKVTSNLAFYQDSNGCVPQPENRTNNGPICSHQSLLSTGSTSTILPQHENASKRPSHLCEDIILKEPFDTIPTEYFNCSQSDQSDSSAIYALNDVVCIDEVVNPTQAAEWFGDLFLSTSTLVS
ncbi:hypothetical protein KP509_24G070000 [Ceratopteris richardii]|uniref:Uncharacterized protein n=1 Tax=Ceratopteris richardii TaxID=49495 RepID=A0A8T2RY06_CERRI|nr:hypothetical protein KP509_24G070000 [Ceratopteris richardii]